ncbi:MAG TPA: mycofactocin system FadH/OYE family oxidoreductase 1 [Ilumatobacteraceae bacterium]
MRLLDPLSLGARSAKNRIVFGPVVTNLGDEDRSISDRHVAFYDRLARGGVGTIVIDEASVHDSDWPYERAPLAARCAGGWAAVAAVCHAHGALAIAGLGHAGGQGSSAYSQRELWAPSRVPEVNSREVPKWMEPGDIAAVVDGFAAAARLAIDRGCDGVEVNSGQHSLVRQFLSGLTNHRADEWGADRLRFAHEVLSAVRSAIGSDAVLGLRLSCDELAPWAGMTPEMAPGIAAALAEPLDYLVVVRGAIFSAEKTRPDLHEPPGFNIDICRAVRAAVPDRVAVVLQGSVVDPGQAEWAVADGVCDAVEMTRAHLADPDLVDKLVAGVPERIRPCLLCNQACQVRDARNPIISCVVEPSTGRETEDPDWYRPAAHPREVVVIGGGPAGLEAARVAAERGHRVRVVEREDHLGGVAAITPPGGPFVDWASTELERLGVEVALNTTGTAAMADSPTSAVVIQCTGSIRGAPTATVEQGAETIDIHALRAGSASLPATGDVVVLDPIGGPIAIRLAEELGERAVLVTQDNIAGNELSRTGDLAPANVRLQQRGVRIVRRAVPRAVRPASNVSGSGSGSGSGAGSGGLEIDVTDRFTGAVTTIAAVAVVDCGFRLPDAPIDGAHLSAGDCVAPRTILEAILEGRRAALAVDGF